MGADPQNLKSRAWRDFLGTDLLDLIATLETRILAEEKDGQEIFPPSAQRFAALELTTPEQVRVVILGQDPYHGVGQAMGLSFSVPKTERIPPSLKNIYREIADDMSLSPPTHGDLSAWAQQGVLLLNSSLSVRAGKAGSHAKLGWHGITDAIIKKLSDQNLPISFLLWGNHAIGKEPLIDAAQHLILTAAHPSPLSAYRGFLGCRHFSATNQWLKEKGRTEIDWTGANTAPLA